jgi:hypothetical protein
MLSWLVEITKTLSLICTRGHYKCTYFKNRSGAFYTWNDIMLEINDYDTMINSGYMNLT